MDRPKLISPALRERKRYLAYHVISESPLEFTDIANGIWHSLLNVSGELGASKTGLWVMKDLFNASKGTGVIKCRHDAVAILRSSLALIDRIGDSKVIFRVLGVSGTIKSLTSKFLSKVPQKSS